MIFVTVGSQLPFDRLIKAVDEWASKKNDIKIFAQIGASDYKPQHFEYCKTMTPDEYNNYFTRADFIVAHVGMGTIISALESTKPLLLMPRLASYGEHRNDHQLATVSRLSHFSNIHVADDDHELLNMLDKLFDDDTVKVDKVHTEVSESLIAKIKNFVNEC